MSNRTFALVVAIESYTSQSGLGKLKGTLDRANEFCEWLMELRRTDPNDIFFCGEKPRHPIRHFGGTRDDIRAAVRDLVGAGRDQNADVFIYCSGHGFQVEVDKDTYEDVLIGANFNDDGAHCIRLDELRQFLKSRMGPGSHFWFVETCRNLIKKTVPELALDLDISYRGHSNPHSLFATADGALARAQSRFPRVLLAGLRGDGRSKIWLNKGYWVTFLRLAEVLKKQATDGNTPISKPGEGPGEIMQLKDVAPTVVTIVIEGASGADGFRLFLSGGDRRPLRIPIAGRKAVIRVPPGDYWAELELGDYFLRRIEPAGDQIVDLYVPATLVFDASDPQESPPEYTVTFDPPGTEEHSFRLRRLDTVTTIREGFPGGTLNTGPEPIIVELLEWDEPVGRTTVNPSVSQEVTLGVSEFLPRNDIKDWLAGREGSLISLADLMDQPSSDGAVADSDPGLLLSLLGAAAISDIPPYRERIASLDTFDSLGPNESAIYVLGASHHGRVVASSEPRSAVLQPISGLEHAAAHAAMTVEPGPHRVQVVVDDVDLVLATVGLPGRVTVLAVSGMPPVPIYQYALRPGHLAATVPDDSVLIANHGILRAMHFAAIVQRRFAAGRAVITMRTPSWYQQLWNELIQGRWPDPITMLIAGYELVRRGVVADHPELLEHLLSGIRRQFGEALLPDLAVLDALLHRRTPARNIEPLVADGRLAGASGGGQAPRGMAIDYRGPWTAWRPWPEASTAHVLTNEGGEVAEQHREVRAQHAPATQLKPVAAIRTGAADAGGSADAFPTAAGRAVRRVADIARENPLGFAIGAAALGFLAGLAIRSKRAEDERLGPVADQVKDKVKETGQEALERGKQVVQEATQSAVQIAKEHGQDLAESARQNARDVGAHARYRSSRY